MSISYKLKSEGNCYFTEGLNQFGSLEVELEMQAEEGMCFNILNQICVRVIEGLKIEDGMNIPHLVIFSDREYDYGVSVQFCKGICVDGIERYKATVSETQRVLPSQNKKGSCV